METTLISVEITWMLGLLIALIFGSYGWTTACVFWLSKKLETIKSNHFAHIDAHLRNKCDDDCEYCQEQE